MTTPRFQTYDFGAFVAVFGPVVMDGYQDGEGFTIEHSSDAFTKKSGTDGKVTRCAMKDRSARVTFKLMANSACNDQLSLIYNLDRNAPNGAGVGQLLIKDNSGRSRFFAAEAWIAKAPDVTADREVTSREWAIDVAFLEEVHGGN